MGASEKPDLGEQRGGSVRLVLWILIVLAGAEFIGRGPVRFLLIPTEWNDLSQNYAASRLWLKGQSPADPRNFVSLWKQESGSRLDLTDIRTHLAPPLGGLVVMAPIAAFHLKTAKLLWLAVLLIAFASAVWALALAAGMHWGEPRTLAFIAGCLALAPFQTGIANANTTILIVGLCTVAIWQATKQHDVTAGILFGIACSMKPQIGSFLVLYYLLRQRWQLFATSVLTTTGLFTVAALYLEIRGTHWLPDYLQNARGFVSANVIDDFSSANPGRFGLINLQVPFFSITTNSSAANWLAFSLVGVLLFAWLFWVLRSRGPGKDMLYLGAVSVVALLPVYHRFYDAALLAVPLCWCLASYRGRRFQQLPLLLMTPFLLPGAAALQQLVSQGKIPDWVTHSWCWNCIVMPHETWTLLLLLLVLLYTMSRYHSRPPEPESTASNLSS